MRILSSTITHSMEEFDSIYNTDALADHDYKVLAHQLGEELIKHAFYSFGKDGEFSRVRVSLLVPDDQFWDDLQSLILHNSMGARSRLHAALCKRASLVERERADHERIKREAEHG